MPIRTSSIEALAFDVRLALRGLRRDWTYTLASIATLAIALALNATVFTVMDAMLFRGFRFVQRNDQIVFLPGETKNCFTGRKGVFDYDTVIFKELWEERGKGDFNKYLRYYMSDHRPMWMQIDYPD